MASFVELGKNKFKLFVELGYDEKGKRIRRTKTVEANGKREADKLLKKFENEVLDTLHLNFTNISFVEFSDKWLETYAEMELEATTFQKYKTALEIIKEHFKHMKLKNIKPFHINEFYNHERKEMRGSLEAKHKVLLSIFKHAAEWQVIDKDKNPMQSIKMPKSTNKQKKDFYRKHEIPKLFSLLEEYPLKHQLIVKFALFGGLRRGEVAGIAADVIDFESNQIEIKRSLQQSTKGLRLKDTKTEDRRIITLPEQFMKDLHNYYIKKLNLKKEMANLWKGFEDINGKEVFLLFSDEYGIPHRPDTLTQFWNRFVERHKNELRRVRFHDLRHSSASLILSEGVNMKIVQKRLGHKDIQTTLNLYSHITEEDDKKASDVFDDFM